MGIKNILILMKVKHRVICKAHTEKPRRDKTVFICLQTSSKPRLNRELNGSVVHCVLTCLDLPEDFR